MFALCTLGTIDLRDEAGERIESVLLHSKRLSLLIYLSTSHPVQRHRRDTLVALLWPELDEAHARGALRHELSRLRHSLGQDALLGKRSEVVGVNPARVWCDARAFEEALEAGCLADALELWHGQFLPGLHGPGGEFDRWLDATRNRLARCAVDAAERLRVKAEERRDLAGAVRWARRRAELDPYDETAWHELLGCLDRAGDRAGALAAYNTLRTRLREELEVEPSPETRSLAERIRRRAVEVAPFAFRSDGRGALGSPQETLPQGPPERSVAGEAPSCETTDVTHPSSVVIALRPVENLTGDPRHDVLSRRLVDRLAQGLVELYFVEAVVGSDVGGATAAVSVTLDARSEHVEVRTRLETSGNGGRVLAVPGPVTMDPEPSDEAIDEVVARVLVSVSAQFDPRVPIAMVGGRPAVTPSWQAWREFLQGSEAFGAFKFDEAARRLRQAYEIDPGFIKAGIFSAMATAYAGDPAEADALATEAMSRATTASDYERHFGEYFLADLHGHRADAYRATMELLRLTSHPVMLALAGREALRMNRPAEALHLLGRREPWQQLGWWRNWVEWYEWVCGAFHVLGDHDAELTTVLTAREHFPEALEVIRAEVRTRAALGQPQSALQLVQEALALPVGVVSPPEVAWTAAQELDAHGHAEVGAAVRRTALVWFAWRDDTSRADSLLEVRLLLETGELRKAQERLEALAPFEDLDSLGLAGLLAAKAGDATTACQTLAQLEGLRMPYLSGRHLLLAAGIRVALGQHEAALDTLRRALAVGLPFGVELHALPTLRPLVPHRDFAALLRPRG